MQWTISKNALKHTFEEDCIGTQYSKLYMNVKRGVLGVHRDVLQFIFFYFKAFIHWDVNLFSKALFYQEKAEETQSLTLREHLTINFQVIVVRNPYKTSEKL